ncbi:MAG: hypothetical protein IKM28_00170 [Lachnospiraceae bacterium]|nr:hypothetical protein [Lachnospiraceae bacterium]
MKRISLTQLLEESGQTSYQEQYHYICNQIKKQKIKPVKSSPLNGKSPALHQSYWLLEEERDYSSQIEELKFQMAPMIQTDYYLHHLDVYCQEEKWVKLLNQYFQKQLLSPSTPLASPLKQDNLKAIDVEETSSVSMAARRVSLNERSFQIWGREKFLQREQGRRVLSHCGVSLEQLDIYETTEPLASYSAHRATPQTILILENKDTFYSMRRHLLSGSSKIFGVHVGTLIYGAGKGILRSYEDFYFCVEPHISHPENRILYFGDLDYEGIGIYERLEQLFLPEHKISPFVQAYERMLEKAKRWGRDALPETKEKQNRNISGEFFTCFSEEIKKEMEEILQGNRYIPQEIINISDFEGIVSK